MRISKLSFIGHDVWILLDDDGRILDWAYLDNIERLEKRIKPLIIN